MRKMFTSVIMLWCVLAIAGCGATVDNKTTVDETTTKDIMIQETTIVETTELETTEQETTIQEGSTQIMENKKMLITIGDVQFEATLENNESVTAFLELMKNGPLTINFSQYGGFEQVGSIGTSLPSSDTQMTTAPGDIVLYSRNQLVMFYGSNSWSYTKIGRIDSLTQEELKNILSNGDVTATFSAVE